MSSEVLSAYDPDYIILSFMIAFLGSFVALSAARRLVTPQGRISGFDLLSATLALGGIGVWTMHFIGMLALKLDVPVGYSIPETVISLLLVCLTTGVALTYVARDPRNYRRMLTAGIALGVGVGLMHYVGMYGMRFGGFINWSYGMVAASVGIAVMAATAALWLAFNTRRVAVRFLAAFVMAGAVCAMHYTGMAAADFVCTVTNRVAVPQGFGVVFSSDLSRMVLVIAIGMTLLLSLDLIAQKLMMRARRV